MYIIHNIEFEILIAAKELMLYFATTNISEAPINVCPKFPANSGNESIISSIK